MSRYTLLFAIAITAIAGCSDRTARVSGKVTLDGEPLGVAEGQRGTVLFRPVEGGATTTAIISNDGTYALSTGSQGGIKPGDYLISVRVVEIVPSEVEGVAPSGKAITPAIYANPLKSGLQHTVRAGSNLVNLELDSTAGPIEPIELQEFEASDEAEGTEEAPAAEAETTELPAEDASDTEAVAKSTEPEASTNAADNADSNGDIQEPMEKQHDQ